MQGQVKAQFAWHGPQTITTGVINNPALVQATPGTFGVMGNFQLVVPLRTGGMGHFFRNNGDPSLPWTGPFPFGTDQGAVDAVSLVQSTFSTQFVNTGMQGPGNLAVVARVGTSLLYFFRDDVDPFAWHGPTMTIATNAYGVPSFIQAKPGTYGTVGNFELVTPLTTGGIGHFFRDNDNPSLPWSQTATFGTELDEHVRGGPEPGLTLFVEGREGDSHGALAHRADGELGPVASVPDRLRQAWPGRADNEEGCQEANPDDHDEDQEQRVCGHPVKDGKANEKVHTNEQRHGIEFRHATRPQSRSARPIRSGLRIGGQ
jgi:hypothetical protein